jgi:hypothetical protein
MRINCSNVSEFRMCITALILMIMAVKIWAKFNYLSFVPLHGSQIIVTSIKMNELSPVTVLFVCSTGEISCVGTENFFNSS